jgi:hypothetical protein
VRRFSLGVFEMRILILVIAIIAAAFSFSSRASASVYDIDLTQPGGLSGTGGEAQFQPGCYCRSQTEFYSAVYSVNPGDTVEFGSLTIYAYQSGRTPDAGPNQPPLLVQGTVSVLFDPPLTGVPWVNPIYDLGGTLPGPVTYDLTYTIPTGVDSIQVA